MSPLQPDLVRPELVRLRLDVAYDGASFAGWARQPDRVTVQGVLEDALHRCLRTPVSLTVAGRTDAGVHATGNVCHVDVPVQVWAAATAERTPPLKRLNGLLDPAVRVPSLTVAPPGFDARFSALSRRYAYRVTDHPMGAWPLRRHDTAEHPRPVALTRLRAASRALVGLHDFAAFCRRREGATTIRTLRRFSWVRDGEGVLVASLEADAFCHQMVRSLVGAVLRVGEGRWEVDDVVTALTSGSRAHGAPVAPACGLTLVEVRYPAASRLAARAQVTQARRALPAPDAHVDPSGRAG